MCAQIGGRKSDLLSKVITFNDGSKDGKFSSEKTGGGDEVARFNGASNDRAADDDAIYVHGMHADLLKAELVSERFEQFEIAGATLAKRPLMPHANLAQRTTRRRQFADEEIGRSGGKCLVEWDDEKMLDPEFAQKEQLVSRRGEKPGRLAGAQNADGVRIKSDDHRGAVDRARVSEGALNDGAMAEMHAVEDANSEHDRPGDRRKVRD